MHVHLMIAYTPLRPNPIQTIGSLETCEFRDFTADDGRTNRSLTGPYFTADRPIKGLSH